MTTPLSTSTADPAARFGQQVAARLSAGAEDLPHDIAERLRAARVQALEHRKVEQPLQTAAAVVKSGGAAALLGSWWIRVGAVVPLLALVAGLVIIDHWQEDRRASELAEVDAALLSGDLPTAAYTDPGFTQFLKSENHSVQ